MNMSGAEVGKIDIDVVHNCIEQCLRRYMTRKEATKTLFCQKNIEPEITELIWQRLEEQNQEFFKMYNLQLVMKEQIMEFNRLLAEQADLMRGKGLVSARSMPMHNGSNVSSIQRVHHAGESPRSAMGSKDMHTPVVTNLSNAFNNHEPIINSGMQSALGVSGHNRGVDVPSNMLLAQSTSMGIQPTMNRGVIKREANYAYSSFNYAASSNFVGSHSVIYDASIPSFSHVDSSLQPLNRTIFDADASSFGFRGQLSQNFNPQNMAFDVSTNPDILDGYSPFLVSNSPNILDPKGYSSRFG